MGEVHWRSSGRFADVVAEDRRRRVWWSTGAGYSGVCMPGRIHGDDDDDSCSCAGRDAADVDCDEDDAAVDYETGDG